MFRIILPPRLFLLCLAGILVAGNTLPRTMPQTLRLPGWALVVAGIAIMLAAWWQFKRAKTNVPTYNQPDVFVTDGLFRYMRNPMYTGFLVALFGAALAAGVYAGLAAPLLYLLAMSLIYVPFEERCMQQCFGEEYAAYARRVRRWGLV